MSKIKNGGLDQYGAGPFEQQQFGPAGVEGVNKYLSMPHTSLHQPRTQLAMYRHCLTENLAPIEMIAHHILTQTSMALA